MTMGTGGLFRQFSGAICDIFVLSMRRGDLHGPILFSNLLVTGCPNPLLHPCLSHAPHRKSKHGTTRGVWIMREELERSQPIRDVYLLFFQLSFNQTQICTYVYLV